MCTKPVMCGRSSQQLGKKEPKGWEKSSVIIETLHLMMYVQSLREKEDNLLPTEWKESEDQVDRVDQVDQVDRAATMIVLGTLI